MFKHKVIDTITAITALILGVTLTASSALAMMPPDPASGAVASTHPQAPPLQQTAAAATESSLTPALLALLALLAVIAVAAAVAIRARDTQRFTGRRRTSSADPVSAQRACLVRHPVRRRSGKEAGDLCYSCRSAPLCPDGSGRSTTKGQSDSGRLGGRA